MGKCESEIREVRFVIKNELTECYVLVEAVGDCPLGVQGWHHKTFPASQSVLDILTSDDFRDYLLWSQDAPS